MTVIVSLEQHHLFSIHRSKSGRSAVIFTADNKKYICSILKQLGYGCSRVDDKKVFFYRDDSRIVPITFFELRRAFGEYLMSLDLSGTDITKADMINEYHHQQPLRNSALLVSILTDTLTHREEQHLRKEMKTAAASTIRHKWLFNHFHLAMGMD